jgi:hypothetical protein
MDTIRTLGSCKNLGNETCNTLKNQGYHYEHNYGHGRRNLSLIFAMLVMLEQQWYGKAREIACLRLFIRGNSWQFVVEDFCNAGGCWRSDS